MEGSDGIIQACQFPRFALHPEGPETKVTYIARLDHAKHTSSNDN